MISLDYETRCDLNISKVGLDRYVSHPSFQVLMAAYRIDDGPLCHWEAYKAPFPQDLRERLLDPDQKKWAFNSQFERVITARGLGIAAPVEGWRCSMVLAYMRSFMGGLLDVGEQMFLPADLQKQKIGTRLIRRFCVPQKVSKTQPHEWRDWRTDPHDWQLFCDYNKTDVIAEEAIRDRLLPFPTLEDEWKFYSLDQRINDNGMPLDRQFAENVMAMSERRRSELMAQMRQWTGLDNPNSRNALLQWLQSQGYEFADIREHSVARALNLHEAGLLNLTEPCVEVLQLRQWAARAATKKAQAALRSVGDDDRIRYMFQFGGASRTQRFAGKGVQPQNMARTPKLLDPEKSTERLDVVTNLIRAGDYDMIDLMVDEPMMVFGGTMRGMFRARPGYRLHVCDYASIESVGLAWVSGCERMLDVFRQGRDAYRDFGTVLYKKPYDAITSAERQVCKPAVLAAGYGMGPGQVLPDGTKTGLLAYAGNMGIAMTPSEAVAAIAAYRDTYVEVPMLWRMCDNAAASVLENGRPIEIGPLLFDWVKPFLLIRLPSGRCIYYHKPQIEEREIRSQRWRWNKDHMRMEAETYKKNVLTYMGRNQRNTQWERIDGRGSSLVENCIAEGTEILTDRGWIAIENLPAGALVWDGVEFVSHDGVVCQGNRQTICVGGVWMTPDHKVLTSGGFVDAGRLEGAPPSIGFDGDAIWLAYGAPVRGCKKRQIVVARALRMRNRETTKSRFVKAKDETTSFVRVLARRSVQLNAWYVRYADLSCMAFYARSLSLADASGVSSVWGSGNYRLPRMGGVLKFLSRYGRHVSSRFNAGTQRQQQRVQPRELRVGYVANAAAQPEGQRDDRDSQRSYVVVRSRQYQRDWSNDSFISSSKEVAGSAAVRSAELYESRVVYDVLNAGPRHRFTVRGDRPFIVSNCVQALTRDILKVGLMRLDAEGFRIIGHAHDEIIVEGDDTYTWERMREVMRQPIDWLPGFPLNANGYSSVYYRK